MDPVTLGLISMGVGSGVKVLSDLFDDSASRQADLMRKQADLKLSGLEENMRRTEGQQTQVLSSTKARMAGTGFSSDSGTFKNYITTMATQFDAQNRFAEESGKKSVDLMRQAADTMDSGGFLGKMFKVGGDLFGGAGSMFSLAKPTAAPGGV